MEASRKGIGGPKTAEGKLRSSLNALKHGLNAVSPQARKIIMQDYEDIYDRICMRMRQHYVPRDFLEEELVKRITRCLARSEYSAKSEKNLIEKSGDPCTPCASSRSLVRYERTVDIHLHRAIRALERKRATEYAKGDRTNSPLLF